MPRNITTQFAAGLQSSMIRPAFLVAIEYPAPVYLWSGVGPLAWNGKIWNGAGTFGNISTVTEPTAVEAQGISLELSGIPTELLADGLDEVNAGAKTTVYFALFDSTGSVIPDPVTVYVGFVDQPVIDLDTNKAKITIAVENRLAHLKRARGGRYTDQDQRAKYPNDASLKWVSVLQDIYLYWG